MRNRKRPRYEELPITNDYIFSRVMLDPEVCKATLEAILGFGIREIAYLETQKSFQGPLAHKAIRLDVYVTDVNGHAYDIEMQMADDCLPRRARYYQSMMTTRQLEVGADYRELTDTYVIFICTFDPFGYGKLLYSFENVCVEHPDCPYGDGARTIFLNLNGECHGHPGQLCDLVRYMKSGDEDSALGGMIAHKVDEVHRDRGFKDGFMTLEEYLERELKIRTQEALEDAAEEGRAEGLKEGREEGRKEGLKEGLKEGRAEGRAEGREEGREKTREENVRTLMGKMGIEAEAAMDLLDVPVDQRAGIVEALSGTDGH